MSEVTDDGRPLYNSKIIDTYLKLIRNRYSYVDVDDLLFHAGMESYQVADEGHWFTQGQVDAFHERLVKVTGNVGIAREAGRYAASPEAIGTTTKYLLGLIGPRRVFEVMDKIAARYTRSSTYVSTRPRGNEIEIAAVPAPGVVERPYQCENRLGYFEAVVRIFNYRPPRIDHPECQFSGGECCRYKISWPESPANLWRRTRNAAAIGAVALTLVVWVLRLDFPAALLLEISAIVILVLTLLGESAEKRDLVAALDNLRSSTDTLLETISQNYNHALMINEIGRTVSKKIRIPDILSGVGDILRMRLDYDRGMLLLANADKTRLEFRTGYGYTDEVKDRLVSTRFHLDRPDSRGVFVVCFHERKPFLVNDVEDITQPLSARSLDFARSIGSKSFICCPIVYEDESLGIIAVDNVRTKRPLLQSDINLLMGIAPEIGVSIYNAMLVEAREQQFRSILQVLAASIDARDFLTAGHSKRVTEHAVGICGEMGMSTDFTEMIRVAAMLHDYGKIGIKDNILKKSGPLSGRERAEIETHAEKTQRILEQIDFEGLYREVPLIAGSHHERMDGSGYPKGLRGEEIPLGARIIAVADFFEAITAKRHYREPMLFEEAVDVLKAERGPHLDPEVVDAFLRFLGERTVSREPFAPSTL